MSAAVVWASLLEYVVNISVSRADQQLYAVYGPAFDYDADGLADTKHTAAR